MQLHKLAPGKSKSTFKTLEAELHKVHGNKYSYFFAEYLTPKGQAKYYSDDILIGGNSELFKTNILKDYDDKIEQYLQDESNR